MAKEDDFRGAIAYLASDLSSYDWSKFSCRWGCTLVILNF